MPSSLLKSTPLLLFALVGSAAGADTVVSNLSGSGTSLASPQSTFLLAQSFVTDDQYYTVDSATFDGARHPAHTVAVHLYAHSTADDEPLGGGVIGEFDASGVTTSVGEQIVPALGTIELAPNTTYWIVLQPSDVNTAFWTQTTDLGNLSGPGSIPNRRAFSTDGGASWTGQTNGTSNLMIRVDATPFLPIFVDGFESGNTDNWSAIAP